MSRQPYLPKPHHELGIAWLLKHAAAALFLDPGLGKTSITLTAFEILRKKRIVERLLVVAPLMVCYNVWPKELLKWEGFEDLDHAVLHGPLKEVLLEARHTVEIINPEGLKWYWAQMRKVPREQWPQMLVVDESTRFKHTTTAQFKMLKQMLDKFRRRVILTGSPVPNYLIDLFGQVWILDGGLSLGRYITDYRLKYFSPSGYGGFKWVIKPHADQEIYKAMQHYALRLDRKDYQKLPPLIETNLSVVMPKKVRQAYRSMEEIFIMELKEGMVVAANAGAKIMKLRQLAGGGVYLGDPGARRAVDLWDEKTERVADLVEELSGKPALIAYEFDHELKRLQRVLKKTLGEVPPHLGGGVGKKSIGIEAAWNRGEIRALLVQPQSASHGLNLQEAGHAVIWHTLTYRLDDYEQLIQRLHRTGVKNKIFCYRVLTEDSVDHAVLAALRSKSRTQQGLLNALRKHYLRRKPG